MSKLSVLLVFGGESSEHDVSISSARNVYAAMDNFKYDTKLCYVDRRGKWWLLDDWAQNLAIHGGAQLVAVPGAKSFITLPGNQVVHLDVILSVIHGHGGEDGTIQGLADLLHLPIVGCDTVASAVCWDKVVTKKILEQNGIQTSPYVVHYASESPPSYEAITSQLGSPIFVKPARAGSSIGVSKVRIADEFAQALEEAHKHSAAVLIEKAIVGRELEIAVLGNPPHHKVSGVGEIIPGEDFYSYDDKYSKDSKAQVIPKADVDPAIRENMQAVANRAYEVLGCRGLARIDFLLSSDNELYINELNTLPGFTNISQYPKLWHEAGMKYPELVDKIIELAL